MAVITRFKKNITLFKDVIEEPCILNTICSFLKPADMVHLSLLSKNENLVDCVYYNLKFGYEHYEQEQKKKYRSKYISSIGEFLVYLENALDDIVQKQIIRNMYAFIINEKELLLEIMEKNPRFTIVLKKKLIEFLYIDELTVDMLYYLKEIFDIELHIEDGYECIYDTDGTRYAF
jgi:hypothetical protein